MKFQIDQSGKIEQTLPISPSPLVGEGEGEGRKRKEFFLKKLRSNQTDAEKTLWYNLRNRRLLGVKFRRQAPIGKYIVDFVSFEKRLIIELDGGQHNQDNGIKKDKIRTNFLEQEGYRVLRYWNTDVIQNLEGVMQVIETAILHPHPDLLPSREKGNDLWPSKKTGYSSISGTEGS